MKLLARFAALFARMSAGEFRAHPTRTVVAVLAIALGVALGFAVLLVNASALAEFAAAVRAASGQSDVEIRGRGLAARAGFDEALLERVLASDEVAAASPVIELDVPVLSAPRDDARPRPALRVLGLDPLRAVHVNAALLGRPDAALRLDPFEPRAIYLSPAALVWLRAQPGETVRLQAGLDAVEFIVAGTLAGADANQRIAVVDIAAAQTRFGRVGRLSRIDVKLADGVSPAQWRERLAQQRFAWPEDAVSSEPAASEGRVSNLSRAYRVNMNMLALVALLTGAFLVYSVQTLAVVRRRAQFALMRIVGLERNGLVAQVVAEGALLGVAGSALGLALGGALAWGVLRALGGDLGGGYFAGSAPALVWSWPGAGLYAGLGTAAAIAGSWMPAREAACANAARAIKGGEDAAAAIAHTPHLGLSLVISSAALAFLPAVAGIALFGYLSIAGMLVGGLWLMPWLASTIARAFARTAARSRSAVLLLSIERIANAPGHAGVVLAGVLASFSLMVAMAIMVASFRHSVDDWLGSVLPADLYVRAAQGADTAYLPEALQRAIAALPGVARADFSRVTQLGLDVARPNVTLIARPLDDPAKRLPLVGDALRTAEPAIYVSEAMIDLYGWSIGKRVALPIGPRALDVTVAGVWRDYARQFGTIAIDRALYAQASGDTTVTDAALTLVPRTATHELIGALRALPGGERLEIASAQEIRAISLRIFDRSFLVTYWLEAVAMVIGLAGIAAAFGAQALSRAKEFGMLRHLGVTRTQVLALLTFEGLLLTAVGTLAGLGLGGLISLVLVEVVNPQSFHWTMDLHAPWALLGAITLALLAAAASTAAIAGRAAVARSAVLAVREDW